MKNLGFANFDLLSMLGMTCLPGMDYELQFVSSTLMVVGIVAIVGIQYCLKASALRKKLTDISDEQKMVAAHHVFDTVDIDENGTIDPEEFELCLNHIAPDKHVLTPDEITSTMVKLGAKIPDGEFLPVLDRSQFVRAVMADKLGKENSTSWIKFLETDKLRSAYISIAVQVMLLCHAPTTKRVLYYFNTQVLSARDADGSLVVGGVTRRFLKVDYSMEMCFTGEECDGRWKLFLPFVLVTLIVYCIALPVYIVYALCKARKNLWSPLVHSCNKGAVVKQLLQQQHGCGSQKTSGEDRCVLLLGDGIGDADMAADEDGVIVLRVAFLNFEVEKNLDRYLSKFDIVLTADPDFSLVLEMLSGGDFNSGL